MLFISAILTRLWDSSAANQECVIDRYSFNGNVHQNKAVIMMQNGLKYNHKSITRVAPWGPDRRK